MILSAYPFGQALKTALFDFALKCAEGSPQQDLYLRAASKLENGEKVPAWIADRFAPLAGQNAYGVGWMRLSITEQAKIVDQFIA